MIGHSCSFISASISCHSRSPVYIIWMKVVQIPISDNKMRFQIMYLKVCICISLLFKLLHNTQLCNNLWRIEAQKHMCFEFFYNVSVLFIEHRWLIGTGSWRHFLSSLGTFKLHNQELTSFLSQIFKRNILQPVLQIKQLWLLFNCVRTSEMHFQTNMALIQYSHSLPFPPKKQPQNKTKQKKLVPNCFTFTSDKASSDSSHRSDSHDQLSCAIAGLAPCLRLSQVTEEVEEVVGTMLIWHCAAAVRVRMCCQPSCSHHHGSGSGPCGCGGYHHEWGGGGGNSHSGVIARAGPWQSPVHCDIQFVAVHWLIVVQDLPLLVHSLPTVEDAEHGGSLVDD